MGFMRILTGQAFNLFARGIVTVTSAHAQLDKTRLYDSRPERAYRSASLAADQFITVDGNLLTDGISNYGNFETWSGGSPVGWTEVNTGTGGVTEELVIFNSGAKSAKLAAGTGTASIYRDVVVKSGEILNIRSALVGDASGNIIVFVYNPLTHKFLQSNLTWSTLSLPYRSYGGGAWSDVTDVITVESFDACQSDLVTLRITVSQLTATKEGYVDDVYVWPRVNFASIHGNTIDPGAGLQLVSSTDNFVGVATNEGAPTILRPSFYVIPAATNQDRRWWGLRHVNAPSSHLEGGQTIIHLEIGESIIGYARQPLQHYEAPVGSDSRWDRLSSVTPGGSRHTHKRSKWAVQNRVFSYHYTTQPEYNEGYEIFHLRPEGDSFPVVIVPDTSLPTVIHGTLRANFPDSRLLVDLYRDVSVELEGSPFASSAS